MVGHRVLGPAPRPMPHVAFLPHPPRAPWGSTTAVRSEAHQTHTDYCDVFLTHDSTSVRKAHNCGKNHLQNVRDYYACMSRKLIQRFRLRKFRAWSIH